MELWDIDSRLSEYLQSKEYDQAEGLLLDQYNEIKAGTDETAMRHILLALASFYSLPFRKNLSEAEAYYREMAVIFPDRESDLRLATFYFYSLRDFVKTIDTVQSMGIFASQSKRDIQFYYSALTLKGQALLYLNRNGDAIDVLRELKQIIANNAQQVPFGDEFNFVNEMTRRTLKLESCKQLIAVILGHIRDKEFKSKFQALLKELAVE